MTAQNNLNEVIDLAEGPSREGLFDALRLRHEGRTVVFIGKNGMRYESSISSIEAEDGSGESWNIKGSARVNAVGGTGDGGVVRSKMSFRFTGYFRTSSPRSGHIKFV